VNQWEVCFLVGLAVYRTAEETLGFPFPESMLKDLASAWAALASASAHPSRPRWI
jgi:hypothetical protein